MNILEVCCGSYYDCLTAYNAGAKRVELNSALFLGGLTPSLGSLTLTKKNTDLEVICMVRPRGAGFCYDESDFETMIEDTKILLENNADGIAFGCLNYDSTVNIKQCTQIITLIKSFNKTVVFHRAFDCVKDPYHTIELLIELGVDRILTSGLENLAIDGIELLQDLKAKYGDKIELLIGSGINKNNALHIIDYTNINQVHSSCKKWVNDQTTTNDKVSYKYHNEFDYDVTDFNFVQELLKAI